MTLEDQEESHWAPTDGKCLISNVTEVVCREVNNMDLGTMCDVLPQAHLTNEHFFHAVWLPGASAHQQTSPNECLGLWLITFRLHLMPTKLF